MLYDMSGELQAAVSRNIRALNGLRQRELTQREIGEALGIDQTAVSNKLKQKRPWSIDEVEKLGQVFGVAPELLFGDTRTLLDVVLPPTDRAATGTEGGRTGNYGRQNSRENADITRCHVTRVISFPLMNRSVAATTPEREVSASIIPLHPERRNPPQSGRAPIVTSA